MCRGVTGASSEILAHAAADGRLTEIFLKYVMQEALRLRAARRVLLAWQRTSARHLLRGVRRVCPQATCLRAQASPRRVRRW